MSIFWVFGMLLIIELVIVWCFMIRLKIFGDLCGVVGVLISVMVLLCFSKVVKLLRLCGAVIVFKMKLKFFRWVVILLVLCELIILLVFRVFVVLCFVLEVVNVIICVFIVWVSLIFICFRLLMLIMFIFLFGLVC